MYKRDTHGWLKHMDFILWDVAALHLAFVLAFLIRMGETIPYLSPDYRNLAIFLVVADILVAAIFNTMHNVLKRGYYLEFVQSLKHSMLMLFAVVLYMFIAQSGVIYSRIIILLTAVFHLVFGYGIRLLWKRIVVRIGHNKQKATMILVANENRIPEFLEQTRPTDGIVVTGVVFSNRDGTGEEILGIPVVANLSNAADYICREWVDQVFVFAEKPGDFGVQPVTVNSIDQTCEPDAFVNEKVFTPVATLIEQCQQMALPVHVRLPFSSMGGKSIAEKVGGYNVLTFISNYVSPLQLAVKRFMDILGGLVGSFFTLILMAILAPMIKKESPGPILFKQIRIGKNGKQFKIYKIRSMYMDAEERKKELLKDNRVSDGMMFKLDWDPRILGNKIVDGKQVTGIGEFIRSHSLDEFPQFFNVLRGQMSLVGTRPPTLDEWEKYQYHHRARLATKPGITGMWQVSGRSSITDFEEVVRLDTEYINRWNIGLDIKIMLKTVIAVLKKDGAM